MCNNEVNPFFGKDIYLIGGGNSFKPELVDILPPDNVVCLNSSVYHFSKCLALFWIDSSWYRKNWRKFGELDIRHTFYINRNKPMPMRRGFKWLELENSKCEYDKTKKFNDKLSGNNVGCCAIQYLDAMGAKNIYLLGFDCKQVEGKSHSHGRYNFKLNDRTYERTFIPCFEKLSKNLRNSKVYNCYAGSALKFFKYKSVHTALREMKNL